MSESSSTTRKRVKAHWMQNQEVLEYASRVGVIGDSVYTTMSTKDALYVLIRKGKENLLKCKFWSSPEGSFFMTYNEIDQETKITILLEENNS